MIHTVLFLYSHTFFTGDYMHQKSQGLGQKFGALQILKSQRQILKSQRFFFGNDMLFSAVRFKSLF